MDNPTSDSSAPHRTKDCIRNLKFVYTTNGGYDYHQARQTAPTGDCMVIAASVATGICYAEAERRLSLLAGSIAKCGDKLGALKGTKSRDPADGTHPLTSKLFLRTHYFVKRGSCHCLCDARRFRYSRQPALLAVTRRSGYAFRRRVIDYFPKLGS
jgi:hypothetical protein